jgi:hypothetical protein
MLVDFHVQAEGKGTETLTEVQMDQPPSKGDYIRGLKGKRVVYRVASVEHVFDGLGKVTGVWCVLDEYAPLADPAKGAKE